MNRRNFLKTIGSTAFGSILLANPLAQAFSVAPGKKRNILLILADDMGRELFECYGGQSYDLPAFKRLADEGMRFDTCYSTPLCVPSRNEILTGKYSFRNYTSWEKFDYSQTTFANLVKQAGYNTAIAGKWQLHGWETTPPGIETAGFDEHCMFDYGEGNRFWGGKLWLNGKLVKREQPGLYGPDIHSDFLIDFMKRSTEQKKPFLAYYCMVLMHRPFQPTPDCPGAPAPGQKPPEQWCEPHGKEENFLPSIKYADKIIAKMLGALKEMGIDDETLIIFAADNGTDNVGEAKNIMSKFKDEMVHGEKYFPVELGLNVPLIARCPELIKPSSVCSGIVDFTDILPTLCDVADAEVPGEIQLDGRSFLPLLSGEKAEPKPVVFSWGNYENSSRKYKAPQDNPQRFVYAVSDGQWKLYSDGRMFNIAEDPLEKNRFSGRTSSDVRKVRDRLEKHLQKLLTAQPRQW